MDSADFLGLLLVIALVFGIVFLAYLSSQEAGLHEVCRSYGYDKADVIYKGTFCVRTERVPIDELLPSGAEEDQP